MKSTLLVLAALLITPALQAQVWGGAALRLTKLDDANRWQIFKEGAAFSTPERQVEFALQAVHETCRQLGFAHFRLVGEHEQQGMGSVLVGLTPVPIPKKPVVKLDAEFSAEPREGSVECEATDDPKLAAAVANRIPKAEAKRSTKKRDEGSARG
jgi:hypothetical protein